MMSMQLLQRIVIMTLRILHELFAIYSIINFISDCSRVEDDFYVSIFREKKTLSFSSRFLIYAILFLSSVLSTNRTMSHTKIQSAKIVAKKIKMN